MNIQLKAQDASALRPLTGKVSLITGSTSGIGLGIARALAQAGSAVVLNGFGIAAEIAKTRDQIAADFGVKVSYSAADMTSREAIAEMIAATVASHGRLDILVNNAGIQHVAPLEQFPVEKWDAILSINLSSAFHTTRLALPAMRQNKFGRIINIASAHGLVGQARHRRPDQGGCAGDCRGRHHLQRDLSRICLYAAGRSPDRRPGQGARHFPRKSHSRRVAGAAAQQAFYERRGIGRADGFSRQRCGGIDHGHRIAGRWRLDRTLE
jgi:NAD(P)-dependent dehydrogenase (short-subunit alcohol dehydrogenase family)